MHQGAGCLHDCAPLDEGRLDDRGAAPCDELLPGWIVIGQISLALALLGAASVFGTDVFFCVVGRTALTRVSDAALVETMGRLHEVADRRMPIFGVSGIVGALASIAFSRASLPWALGAVAAQVLWIVVYRSVAAPVNAELTRHARAGSVPSDARALQARWDSVIVVRVFLMGFTVVALAAALVASAR
jgi:hypothetical protein